jgi:hypothetical protein
MLNRLGMALGAGLVSALLFIVVVRGTMSATLLACLAPMPIMLATLGWGVDVGLIGLGVACAVVAGVVEPTSAALYGASFALPGWALAALAKAQSFPRLRRAAAAAPVKLRAGAGALALTAAGLAALLGVGSLVAMILTYGGYQAGVEGLLNLARPSLQEALDGPIGLPEGFTIDEYARMAVKNSPTTIAIVFMLIWLFNLYVAGRVTLVSQRLGRPWPDVPSTLVAPRALGALAVGAGAVWLLAPEPTSQVAFVFVGVLGVTYLAIGLAALHALSRRLPARPFLILAMYFACFAGAEYVLPAVALFGIAESLAKLRARAAAHPVRP